MAGRSRARRDADGPLNAPQGPQSFVAIAVGPNQSAHPASGTLGYRLHLFPCPQRPSRQAHVAGVGQAVTKASLSPLAPVADILRA